MQEGSILLPEHSDVTGFGVDGSQSPVARNLACPAVSAILSRIGDKWSVLVVMQLGAGPRRFNEIKRLIDGISQRMLTLTLRGLERDGLVHRQVYHAIPPKVEYSLTDLGHSLREPVQALGAWAIANRQLIDQARRDFDIAHHTEQDDALTVHSV
jgi:DNA-binding HxlR family transcriptional regulator